MMEESRQSSICTSSGIYRRKYHLRAAFQSAAFLILILGAAIYNTTTSPANQPLRGGSHQPTPIGQDYAHQEVFPFRPKKVHRKTLQSCDDIEKANPRWLIVFHSIGVLYMFLALAIVCDEFFVPALEEMASSRRMNLSMDVAGATLMAAGGSAPELFSSLFGTFQESEIGFGTIIGSAVFNVLFVIAMCAVFSKDVLQLTWWPLFRDSLCYAIGLTVLAIFVGVSSKERIELYESFILFGLYICYILIMWKNADIYRYITGKELVYPTEDDESEDNENPTIFQVKNPEDDSQLEIEHVEESAPSEANRPPQRRLEGKSPSQSSLILGSLVASYIPSSYFNWQGTFRAGILKLLRNPDTWVETGGMGIVAKIAGDADAVFHEIDANKDGCIDIKELKRLFDTLECNVTEKELEEVFDALDEDKDGAISKEEFHKWYTTSAELIRSQVKSVFESLDTNNSGTIDKYELKSLLLELDPRVTDQDCKSAIDEMYKRGSRDEITFEEFEEWYGHSIIYEKHKKAVEEDMEGVWESLKPPKGEGVFSWIQYIVLFPLVAVMAITIPDVRIPGRGKWCYLAFFMSIIWIGLFAYLMVGWAELIGNTLGIPSVIMGLTVLAAGTSVPDLLSSVIVARRGSGDMAVSSSIGSNIFDILVGLPVPWILYSLWENKAIEIESDNIFISLFILIGMLVFVIAAVHCQGWKLTKTLGAMMIAFYVGFLVQAIAFELPFKTCLEV